MEGFLSRRLEGTEPHSSKGRQMRGEPLTLLCQLSKGSLRPPRHPAVLHQSEEQPWGPGSASHLPSAAAILPFPRLPLVPSHGFL